MYKFLMWILKAQWVLALAVVLGFGPLVLILGTLKLFFMVLE